MKKYFALRAFARYVGEHKGPFVCTCLSFALADLPLAFVPVVVGQLVAAITRQNTASSHIVFWTALLVACSVGHDILWRTSEVLYLKLLNAWSNRFDDVIFRAVIRREYAYFADKFSGKIGSYATSLGREFRELLDNFCYDYLDLLIRLPIIGFIMFTVNFNTGLIYTASLVTMFFVGRKLATVASRAERHATDQRSNMDGYIVDTIANFVSVKAFGKTDIEADYIHKRRGGVIAAANTSRWKDIFFWGTMSLFVRWIIWPSTIIYNVYLFRHHGISLAQLSTFLTAVVLFTAYIWEVIWNVSQLNTRFARIEEAYEYLFGKRDIPTTLHATPVTTMPPVDFSDKLELRNVHFSYPDKTDVLVLKDISLTVKCGEKIGIVGHSGGGKTTLVKLLLGYYPLPPNLLYVDGKPADNTKLNDLLAYVPQDTALFHRSIRENIAYSRPDASEPEIIAAAKHAQAHEFISELPDGYGTLVGERGIKLSGGQRQRIAIARAILKDAPILVLDEATSSLDSHSEALIQKALGELMRQRTAIVIAHRLSTIQKMDRIVVLDQGRIVEQGSHAKLLATGGIYAQLWQHQAGGFIKA